jgi:ADP-heptose:LPS heptosyltransferase
LSGWDARGKKALETVLLLIPRGARPEVPAPPGRIRRILVVRPDERIGNLILLTPMLDALHRAWPGAIIDLIVGGAMATLFAGDPRVGRIHVFDKRRLVRNPLGVVTLAARLRRGRYDLAIDASHSHQFSLTSALAARASGAPWRLGYLRGPGGRLLNAGLERDLLERRYTADLYIDLLRVLAPDVPGGPLHLPITPAEADAARRLLSELGIEPGAVRIGFHPGGRGAKRWPGERFVELARQTVGPGRRILLFHGPGEEKIVESFPQDLVTVVPRLDLRDLAATIARCDAFVSSDTGPMHLAAAVSVPTLALFTQGNSDMFAPRGPRHKVLDEPGGSSVSRAREALEAMLAAAPRDDEERPAGQAAGR